MPADTRPGSTIYRLLDDDDDKGDDGDDKSDDDDDKGDDGDDKGDGDDDKGDGDDGGGDDVEDDQSKAHESDQGDPRVKMNMR